MEEELKKRLTELLEKDYRKEIGDLVSKSDKDTFIAIHKYACGYFPEKENYIDAKSI